MVREQIISLVPLDRRHLAHTRAWVNDPEIMRLLNRADYVSEEEHEEWFKRIKGKIDSAYFAIETDDHKHVGNIWLWEIDQRQRRAEVRIVIGDKSQFGKGLGTEAIRLISDYAFSQLKLHKVYAYVLSINPRARAA